MTEEKSLLAVFSDLEPAADAIEQLRHPGRPRRLHERHLRHPRHRSHARTSQPVDERPAPGDGRRWWSVSSLGLFLAFVTPNMYPIQVGGQPFFPVPPRLS